MSRMTEAQMSQYVCDQLKYHDYELRKKRLDVMKYYGVRVEVTSDLRKCYVMGRLVVGLPRSRIFEQEFKGAVRHVLNTLIAVNGAVEY